MALEIIKGGTEKPTTASIFELELTPERIVVLGGGESGCGTAILAHTKGLEVFLSDRGTIAPRYREMLEKWGIPYEEGQHTELLILNASRVVKSPGIPDKAPLVVALRERGIPVISEIEFTAPYTSAKTICITGSNGKTTVTTLIYEMLSQAGFNVALAGNIGESFALSVATEQRDWYVIELSSFQLDGTSSFKADVAVLMNITPDHLDRYNYCFQNYVDSKFRIIANQTDAERFIYCADDPTTVENLPRHTLSMQQLPFGVKHPQGCSACSEGEMMRVSTPEAEVLFPVAELPIRGLHNLYNAMAATLASLSAGVSAESICATLRSFEGVEHRLESCGEVAGVHFINDSKATNVDSVWYALESMTRPVVWIAGGTDKGNDYSALYPLLEGRVKALICMGVDNEKLKAAFAGRIERIEDTHSLEEAVALSSVVASAGDAVLLSPACASFDLFKNYEDRGRQFKAAVENLKAK